jgi:hypothetical protein
MAVYLATLVRIVVNAGNVIYHHQVNHGQLGQGGGVPFPADGEMLEDG